MLHCRYCDTQRVADSMFVCGRCTAEFYCGKSHQQLDWHNHESVCDRMAILGDEMDSGGGDGEWRKKCKKEELLTACSLPYTLTKSDFPAIRSAFAEAQSMGFRKARSAIGPGLQCSPIGAYYMKMHHVMREIRHRAVRHRAFPEITSIKTLYVFDPAHRHHRELKTVQNGGGGGGGGGDGTLIDSEEKLDAFWCAFEHCFERKRSSSDKNLVSDSKIERDGCALAHYVEMLLVDPQFK